MSNMLLYPLNELLLSVMYLLFLEFLIFISFQFFVRIFNLVFYLLENSKDSYFYRLYLIIPVPGINPDKSNIFCV